MDKKAQLEQARVRLEKVFNNTARWSMSFNGSLGGYQMHSGNGPFILTPDEAVFVVNSRGTVRFLLDLIDEYMGRENFFISHMEEIKGQKLDLVESLKNAIVERDELKAELAQYQQITPVEGEPIEEPPFGQEGVTLVEPTPEQIEEVDNAGTPLIDGEGEKDVNGDDELYGPPLEISK